MSSNIVLIEVAKKKLHDTDVHSLHYVEQLSSYLALDKKGLTLVDGLKSTIRYVELASNDRHLMSYVLPNGALVLCDGKSLSIRRDSHRNFLLKTAFCGRFDNFAKLRDSIVNIELLTTEAAKLIVPLNDFRKSSELVDDENVGSEFSKQLNEQIKDVENQSNTVVLHAKWDRMQQFVAQLLRWAELKDPASVPIISAILEKLVLLCPQPYAWLDIDSPRPCIVSEAARRISFAYWPHMHYKWALPEQMAEAGFYHQGNDSGDDRAMCFTCGVCLVCWEPSDEPWAEHERHMEMNCPFVKGQPTNNVPVDVTYAAWPALDTQMSESVKTISTVSNAEYMATCSEHGEIALWHVGSLPQKCANFQIDPSDPGIGARVGYSMRPFRKSHRVSWADTDLISYSEAPSIGTTPPEVCIENLTANFEPNDLLVMASSICGPPKMVRTGSFGTSSGVDSFNKNVSPALVVGCGCLERKLKRQNSPSPGTSLQEDQIADDSNSLLANLNALNSSNGNDNEYRPFILVYRISDVSQADEAVNNDADRSRAGNISLIDEDENEFVSEESIADDGWPDSPELGLPSGYQLEMLDDMYDYFAPEMPAGSDATGTIKSKLAALTDEGFSKTGTVSQMEDKLETDVEMTLADSNVQTPKSADVVVAEIPVGQEPAPALLAVQLQPPTIEVPLLQCIKLPPELDVPGNTIFSIIPLPVGNLLVVVVNKAQGGAALLCYQMSFRAGVSVLVEEPIRFISLNDRVVSFTVLHNEIASGVHDRMGFCTVVLANGSFVIVALESASLLVEQWPMTNGAKFVLCCGAPYLERLSLVTDSNEFVVYTINVPNVPVEVSFEERLLTSVEDNQESAWLTDQFNDKDLLLNEPLSHDSLVRLRQVTCCEREQSMHGIQVVAPPCWMELQSHLRSQRRSVYVHDNIRSWHLLPDGKTWNVHQFEVTLSSSFCVGHLDIHFAFHQSVVMLPEIEVSILKRVDDSIPATILESPDEEVAPSVCVEPFLLAGPVLLRDCLHSNGLTAVAQFAWTGLPCGKAKSLIIRVRSQTDAPPFKISDNVKIVTDSTTSTSHKSKTNKDASSIRQRHGATAPSGSKPSNWISPTDQKKTENFKGCDWIQEISICAWKFVKTDVSKERKVRLGMLFKQDFVDSLMQAFIDDNFNDVDKKLAIDILSWIIASVDSILVVSVATRAVVLNVVEKLARSMQNVFDWAFLQSGRSEARKTVTLVLQLLRVLEKVVILTDKREVLFDFVAKLHAATQNCIGRFFTIGFASSFVWMNTFVRLLIDILDALSSQWPEAREMRRSTMQLIHDKLHDLTGELVVRKLPYFHTLMSMFSSGDLPFELEMFELPAPVLTCSKKSNLSPTFAEVTSSQHYASWNVIFDPSQLTQSWSDFCGLHLENVAKQPQAAVKASEMPQMNNVMDHGYLGYPPSSLSYTNALMSQGFCGGVVRSSPADILKSVVLKVPVDMMRLYGLIEVQPLHFDVFSASEGVKIENMETGAVVKVSSGDDGIHTSGSGPIPLPDFSQQDAAQASNPALAQAVSSMQQQVQSLLSKQMQLFALQHQKNKLQGKLNEHAAALADAQSSQPTTQHSSASTFGVPTTPKTTPFMTPTPLSPSHLSPMNSESQLNLVAAQDHGTGVSDGGASDSMLTSGLQSAAKSFTIDLLKPPAPRALIIDRMTAGARRFVVLDLQRPVLLTDLLFPQCAELGSLAVQVWLKGEQIDKQHVVTCDHISSKSLALCDMQPPFLCQFVKDLRIVPGLALFNPKADQLIQFLEDLKCKHSLASDRLKLLLQNSQNNDTFDDSVLTEAYRNCMHLKMQWNVLRRMLCRFSGGGSCSYVADANLKSCSTDKLMIASEIFIQQLSLHSSSTMIGSEISPVAIDLTLANVLFTRLAVVAPHRLRALLCSLLLHNCSSEPWWGEMLVQSVCHLVSSELPLSAKESLFMMLCYMATRSVSAQYHNVIADALKVLNRTFTSVDPDTELVEWLLIYISTCFDAINSRLNNWRWDFMQGEYHPKRQALPGAKIETVRQSQMARKTPKNTTAAKLAMSKVAFISQAMSNVHGYSSSSATFQTPTTRKSKSSTSSNSTASSQPKRPSFQLNHTVCHQSAKLLLNQILHCSNLYKTDSLIASAKVLSHLSKASSPRLHLLDFCDCEQLNKLLSMCMRCRNPQLWFRHALLMSLQDILKGEIKCSTSIENQKKLSMQKENDNEEVTTPTSSKGHGSGGKKERSPVDDGAVIDLDSAAGAHALVQKEVDTLEPLKIDNCKIDYSLREIHLKMIATEVFLSDVSNGKPLSKIGDWKKEMLTVEFKVAKTAKTSKQYSDLCSKLVSSAADVHFLNKFSDSSIGWPTGTFGSEPHGLIPPPNYASISFATPPGGPMTYYSPNLNIAQSEILNDLSSKVSGQSLAQVKQELSQLCEQISMSSQSMNNNEYFNYGALALPSIQGSLDKSSTKESLGSGNSSSTESLMISDVQADVDVNQQAKNIKKEPVPTVSTNKEEPNPFTKRLLPELTKQISCLRGEHSMFSYCTDARSDINLNVTASIQSQVSIWHDAIKIAELMKNQTLPKNKFVPSAIAPCQHISSYNKIGGEFSSKLKQYCASRKLIEIEDLLSVFWQLVTGAGVGNSKTDPETNNGFNLTMVPLISFDFESLNLLIECLANCSIVDASLWNVGLKVLTAMGNCDMYELDLATGRMGKRGHLGVEIAKNSSLSTMITNFIASASNIQSNDQAGVVHTSLINCFIGRLYTHSVEFDTKLSTAFLNRLALVLVEFLGKRNIIFGGGGALDIITKLIESLYADANYVQWLDSHTAVELVRIASRLSYNLINRSTAQSEPTIPGASLVSCSANPRYCNRISQRQTGSDSVNGSTISQGGLMNCEQTEVACIQPVLMSLLRLVTEVCKSVDPNNKSNSLSVTLLNDAAVDEVFDNLFSALNLCVADESGCSTVLPPIPKNTTISVCDAVFGLVTCILQQANASTELMLKTVKLMLSALENISMRQAYLSRPLLQLCVDLFEGFKRSDAETFRRLVLIFVEIGGIESLIGFVMTSYRNSFSDVDQSNGIQVMRQCASMLSQVRLFGRSSSTVNQYMEEQQSRRPHSAKIDGLYNFAPTARISSSNPMAHQLAALLSPVHQPRRARTAAWVYHFYPSEMWLDIQLTLPQQIHLSEVQIRPHIQSLQTAPSAVQVELAPDVNPSSFQLLGPVMVTAGRSKIRINTSSYGKPVQVVRLHLRRPVENAGLGVTQIALLGNQPFIGESAGVETMITVSMSDCVTNWLKMLHFVVSESADLGLLAEGSLLRDLTKKPLYTDLLNCLGQLIVMDVLNDNQLNEVTRLLDTVTSADSTNGKCDRFFDIVLNRLVSKTQISSSVVNRVVSLIDGCISNSEVADDVRNARILSLLNWTIKASTMGQESRLSSSIVSGMLWAMSCVVWKMTDHQVVTILADNFKCDNLKLLMEMWQSRFDETVRVAIGYLLAAICHRIPTYFDTVTNVLITSANREDADCCAIIPPPDSLALLSLVFQSKEGVCYLIDNDNDILSNWFSTLNSLLTDVGVTCELTVDQLHKITAVLNLIVNLSAHKKVLIWLSESMVVREFIVHLLRLLSSFSSMCSVAMQVAVKQCEEASAAFFSNFASFRFPDAQKFLAEILCGQLKMAYQSTEGLSCSMQLLILNLLLQDETISLCLIDERSKIITTTSQITINHPRFGCSPSVKVVHKPVSTTCQQLMNEYPPVYSQLSVLNETLPRSAQWSESRIKKYEMLTSVKHSTVLQSAKRLASISTLPVVYIECSKMESFSGQPLPGLVPLSKLYTYAYDVDEDTYDLSLLIRQSPKNEIKGASMSDVDLAECEVPRSLLQVFAENDGLALMASHLQPNGIVLLGADKAKNKNDVTSRDHHGVSSSQLYYTENELMMMDEMSDKTSGPIFDEWVTIPPVDPIPTSTGGAAATSVAAGVGVGTGGIASSIGLLPHTVVSFAVLLKLPHYAYLLVSKHKAEAQCLLRLAMGISIDGQGDNILNGVSATKLPTLPFEVLETLYKTVFKNGEPQDGVIRESSLDLGVIHLLLTSLGSFSHQKPVGVMQSKPEICLLIERLGACLETTTSTQQQQHQPKPVEPEKYTPKNPSSFSAEDKTGTLYWAKGTGFGTGSTQQSWNMQQAISRQLQDEQHVACILKVLAAFVCPDTVQTEPSAVSSKSLENITSNHITTNVLSLFDTSCLVPALSAYLRNDSVLDISRHVTLYESVLSLICSLAISPTLRSLLTRNKEQSLIFSMAQMKRLCDQYASKIKPLQDITNMTQSGSNSSEGATLVGIPPTDTTNANVVPDDGPMEESLLRLVELMSRVQSVLEHCLGEECDYTNDLNGHNLISQDQADGMTIDELYCKYIKQVQFDSIDFMESASSFNPAFNYHYESNVKQSNSSGMAQNAARIRRLAQEAVTLSSALPYSASSSVFVRCAQERLDVMKVLMTGPADTPYANGCFEFDVWFPNDYPNSPMQVHLVTTGNHSIRFNPNLYNDGKVCLSILNTWHGRPEERWNAQTSSLLQVLVSIQSLILVPEPYFNEPGYERSRNTPAGKQASLEYDANIEQATVRWAMLDMIRNPPIAFSSVIKRHFWLKRDEILKQVAKWITDLDDACSNSSGIEKRVLKTIQHNLTALKRHYAALSDELMKMQKPEDVL